ncbi:glutamine synthetase family protein [Helcobacillus massiliensis]|uniref:glutamine synthetase family protein n=1 Tax=Helcobacillus massiliensis TaxID=521392 RepID=UPI0021A69410|nr:glutamine synthetase family protein [Helcobacillus massiliensis]MCT1558591.1 glutamine synthetase family protein [Helcobacillus massiliensis]MCT2037432.1 glutamine synthetase family protein [Helcobacillus massiliensis]MCT2332781.1 glutamine synthetase family protein [Helcobacillus massiliensis]
MAPRTGMLTLPELTDLARAGEMDTVIVAFTDMQGRLVGKRISARLFIESVADHGAECCNYLLAVDIDNNTLDGYKISSWKTGYGDMVMKPDMTTLRLLPWIDGTAMVTADLLSTDGVDIAPAPRAVLKRQVARLAEHGWVCQGATELEFIIFDDSYREAWAKGYQNLQPASDYNTDYAIHASTRLEPLLRDIRNGMDGAGMYCEGVKGECNPGQQEISFMYDEAVVTCDNHSIYRTGAKEIADKHGKSITFMAKYNEKEGSSCHIHMSLRDEAGNPVFSDPSAEGERSKVMQQFLAGQLAAARELSLLFAPNINSYKRYQPGSFAPTTIAWGIDNRSCAFRVVGHGEGLRFENRIPGGDVNQYLAMSAMIAAGLHGIENELELEPMLEGNGYEADKPQVPHTLRDAKDLFAQSEIARRAFGDDVVDHYVRAAEVEIEAYDAAVTDWERKRGFERG